MTDGLVYVVDDDERVRRALCRLLASVDLYARP
jgi:FixJ family two-component response regulator